jgi:Domain of unknown function (DUF4253)
MTEVPADGELQVGAVRLPAGRRVHAGFESVTPVAWATTEPLPEPGLTWWQLSAQREDSGLAPILLAGLDHTTRRPWDVEEFGEPADVSQVDHLSAAELLAECWSGETGGGEEEEDEEFWEMLAPFGLSFPGLAPATTSGLSPARLQAFLAALAPARIGLVPAARPADVLPRIGWNGSDRFDWNPLPIAAVLRSWEDRFGARLLEVGFARIRLLVERPPATIEAARAIAAEHFAFCDEAQVGLHDVGLIADSLVNAPLWTFWWD